MTRALIDYLVLDSLADDVESLEQIVPSLDRAIGFWEINPPNARFTRADIVLSITRLVEDRLIEAVAMNTDGKSMSPVGEGVQPRGALDDYWFQMTPRGRILHTDWDPPPERENRSRFAT